MTTEVEPKKRGIKEVYNWAARNTAESRASSDYKYVPTHVVMLCAFSLSESEGAIIALVGRSGIGKSSAVRYIKSDLESLGIDLGVPLIRWTGDLDELVKSVNSQVDFAFFDFLIDQIGKRLNKDEQVTRKVLHTIGVSHSTATNQDWDSFKKRIPLDDYDALLDFVEVRGQMKVKRDYLRDAFRLCHSILIDFRDYSATDRRLMQRDLGEVETFWKDFVEGEEDGRQPNLLFVLQKELAYDESGKPTHFLIGKARPLEINPLPPDELVDAYKKEFGSIEPFQEDALEYIAKMSLGIFRRFLRCVQLCIEKMWITNSNKVDLALAHEAIAEKELEQMWEPELRQILGNSWRQAFRLIMLLIDKGPMIQKELASKLGMKEYEITRLIVKLEDSGYIARSTTGNGKRVSANV